MCELCTASFSNTLADDDLLKLIVRSPIKLQTLEDEYIRRVFRFCGNSPMKAAVVLGIGKTSIYRHLNRLGICLPRWGGPTPVALSNRSAL
jgi:DNA-binding NtrC family response regulator